LKHEAISIGHPRRQQTAAQRRGLEKATRRAAELRLRGELDDERHGAALVASLGEGGFMTWESSPLVMWLATIVRFQRGE
jgi:hypothetical protein